MIFSHMKTNIISGLSFIYSDQPDPGINSLKQKQNGRHFTDNIFKCIFLNETIWIFINISLKFVHKGRINNIPALL